METILAAESRKASGRVEARSHRRTAVVRPGRPLRLRRRTRAPVWAPMPTTAQGGNPPCWCSFEWSWEMN